MLPPRDRPCAHRDPVAPAQVEAAHTLYYYHERGLLAEPPTLKQVEAMLALTQGSGAELRRWCVGITQTDMGLL